MNAQDRQIYHVEGPHQGNTLAALLRLWRPGQSWSEVRKLIRGRQVLVNGNLCVDDARRLQQGEVVCVQSRPAAPLPTEDDVKVRFWDADVVIVEKPAGMTTLRHSEERNWSVRRKQFQPTLDEILPRVLAKIGVRRTRRGGLPPVRAVHRLDRETSGLMAFARSVEAERHLQEQFRQHTTGRRYLALVHGRVQAQTIESYLVRDRGDGRRGSAASPASAVKEVTQESRSQDRSPDGSPALGATGRQSGSPNSSSSGSTGEGTARAQADSGKASGRRLPGKRAVTHVEPIEYLPGYTLISCTLETGRTHQIRIHLCEQGHPVCGDKVYRRPQAGAGEIPDSSQSPRLFLHAAELAISHPQTGARLEYRSALPPDLQAVLDRLRSKPGKSRRASQRSRSFQPPHSHPAEDR